MNGFPFGSEQMVRQHMDTRRRQADDRRLGRRRPRRRTGLGGLFTRS